MSTPAHTPLTAQQCLTKSSVMTVTFPPYSPNLTLDDYLFWFKGKCFGKVEEVKPKNGRSTTRHQSEQVQNCFEQWRKRLHRVLQRMEGTSKVTEVYTRKNTQFFINKFRFFESPCMY